MDKDKSNVIKVNFKNKFRRISLNEFTDELRGCIDEIIGSGGKPDKTVRGYELPGLKIEVLSLPNDSLGDDMSSPGHVPNDLTALTFINELMAVKTDPEVLEASTRVMTLPIVISAARGLNYRSYARMAPSATGRFMQRIDLGTARSVCIGYEIVL